MAAWNDPFRERIRANVRQCDKCGTELDEGDNAYFTGLDMLCLDCAEAEAKAQAEQDTVETIQTRFHAMEQRGLTRRDIDALYDLLQDVVGDEERDRGQPGRHAGDPGRMGGRVCGLSAG